MTSPLRNAALLLTVALVVLGSGCGQGLREREASLSEVDALALAVELANDACQTRYHRAPFTVQTFDIRYADDRWHWGRLDPAGPGGYSAEVSFDARGEDRAVEVYFSTDHSNRAIY